MAVNDPSVVDLVSLAPDGAVALVMVEPRPWLGREQLFDLQEKVNSYASYALDGGLLSDYPHMTGRPIRLELRCPSLPRGQDAEFISGISKSLSAVGLEFRVVQSSVRPLG
jgi:hypothetical protein